MKLKGAASRAISFFFIFVALPLVANAQDGLKIYISADMEGVVGVVTDEQLGPGGF